MKAARQYSKDEPLVIEDIPEPKLRPGSVIVKIDAAYVSNAMADVLAGRSGEWLFLPPMPYTPGIDCVGIVEAVADDVVGLDVGQKVYCDPHIRSKVPGAPYYEAFIGYFGLFSPFSLKLLSYWRDGAFAEKLVIPAECVTPLGAAESVDPALLTRLGYVGTSYGGLVKGGFRPSESLIVTGATSVLGVSAVLLGLGMGASKVVAVGRKEDVLKRLRKTDPKRVAIVVARGDDSDADRIRAAAGDGGADLLLDCVRVIGDPQPTLAGVSALRRPGGAAVFVGGVSATIPIQYPDIAFMGISMAGSVWFPPSGASELLRMIGSGVLDLSSIKAHTYSIEKINEALVAAASRPSGFDHFAITPNTL